MASINDIIAIKAPDLATDPNKNTYIELAQLQTDACFFGSKYTLAVALRASHSWALDQKDPNESGAISGKRMGPVSISFNTPNQGSDDLSMTSYGRQLRSLIRSCGPGISVTGTTGTINGACGL